MTGTSSISTCTYSPISDDSPFYKLNNELFNEFLEKHTHTIPDAPPLRWMTYRSSSMRQYRISEMKKKAC